MLSGYLLSSQGDRVSMANSVESRYPYLDLKFLKYIFNMPRGFKVKGNFFKRILRQSYSDSIPTQIVDSPKIAYQAPEARAILKNQKVYNHLKDNSNPIFNYYSFDRIQKIIHRISSNSSSSRGGFCDNMTINIVSSLALLLND